MQLTPEHIEQIKQVIPEAVMAEMPTDSAGLLTALKALPDKQKLAMLMGLSVDDTNHAWLSMLMEEITALTHDLMAFFVAGEQEAVTKLLADMPKAQAKLARQQLDALNELKEMADKTEQFSKFIPDEAQGLLNSGDEAGFEQAMAQVPDAQKILFFSEMAASLAPGELGEFGFTVEMQAQLAKLRDLPPEILELISQDADEKALNQALSHLPQAERDNALGIFQMLNKMLPSTSQGNNDEEISQLLTEFAPLFSLVLEAVNGNQEISTQLSSHIVPDLQKNGWNLGGSIEQILAQERDVIRLTEGLDEEEEMLICHLLKQLDERENG
ncbi:hypothetical protein [Candidatus Venteria ishoeyi]|uniref:Uncharacterized protein n=1 Tax=Candidatus Venteria ishoeyi TaxID=1899563 RepID=A0A1H6FA68_9GAMM|nr:hypothetical protein [Candidatus Venteria ishoeyi]MDM8547647.1 hypothetical protein [Candidatus Venteria ishoeyi]SEH05924.1 Uncharacterised protein [Candidatus Venteria ishoeyi]